MARTPLLSRLQRIAAQAARQTDPAGSGICSRRALLRAGGAAAAVAALGVPGWARARSGRARERIAVVGGGLAGLTAAYRLLQAGYQPQVYEAATGLGGRVRTNHHTFASGQRVERGGEFIDSGHTEYRKLIHELGFQLDDIAAAEPPNTAPLYSFHGAPYSDAQATADFQAVLPRLAFDLRKAGYPTLYNDFTPYGQGLDQMSVLEWIDSRVPGGMDSDLGRLLDVAYNIEYGAESEVQSSLNLIYLLGFGNRPGSFEIFGESDERYRVAGGNDQVPAELARLLGSRLHPGHRLEAAVTLPDGSTALEFAVDGGMRTVLADQVVMTVPFRVLNEQVDLDRLQLSPLKRTAIAELRMGTNSKLHVQFQSRFWYGLGQNGDTYADTGFQNTWEETRAQAGTEGILVDYTGGKTGASFDTGTPQQRAARFLNQLEPLMPGITAQWNGRVSLDYWTGSPFQLGSYSYWRVGQYTGFAGVEREAEGGVHFAGEHTSINFQGFMNGAVETGQRAAHEVYLALH